MQIAFKVAMLDAMKFVKGVKIIHLINYNVFNLSKGQNLKKEIELITKYIDNFEENKSSVLIFFTHCPKDIKLAYV